MVWRIYQGFFSRFSRSGILSWSSLLAYETLLKLYFLYVQSSFLQKGFPDGLHSPVSFPAVCCVNWRPTELPAVGKMRLILFKFNLWNLQCIKKKKLTITYPPLILWPPCCYYCGPSLSRGNPELRYYCGMMYLEGSSGFELNAIGKHDVNFLTYTTSWYE